jgi:hypothetical protein
LNDGLTIRLFRVVPEDRKRNINLEALGWNQFRLAKLLLVASLFEHGLLLGAVELNRAALRVDRHCFDAVASGCGVVVEDLFQFTRLLVGGFLVGLVLLVGSVASFPSALLLGMRLLWWNILF